MSGSLSTLGLIPARSGSKGVPGKNTRLLAGKPLLAWAVGVSRETCDWTYVSTDDSNIGLLAAQYGAGTILRPAHLAQGESGSMLRTVQHAIRSLWDSNRLKPDVVVLLQPTQPLRTVRHVRSGLALLTDEWDSVTTVIEVPERWRRAERVVDERLHPEYAGVNRQDLQPTYVRDGTFYISRVEAIEGGTLDGDCRAYVVPESESCNIDAEEDFLRAERMMKARFACGLR